MSAIGPEYDNKAKPTPRVMGVAYSLEDEWSRSGETFGFDLAISRTIDESFVRLCASGQGVNFPGIYFFVQTYDGSVDYSSFDPKNLLGKPLPIAEKTAQGLADRLYDSSDYIDPKYGDLRVCTVAGVRNGNGPGGWEIARRNRHIVNQS